MLRDLQWPRPTINRHMKRGEIPKCPKCGSVDVVFARKDGQYKVPATPMWECKYCWHRWPRKHSLLFRPPGLKASPRRTRLGAGMIGFHIKQRYRGVYIVAV